ncbi:CoB--CoM heterodisulfide reductase iron-sulfur subunit B family protein [Desulfopila sp. IMCC35008]|uniref:CoB--CoM heterodisulfide reductase iron-sulfur subunit B family protein n=1 Tax=Desulfopila sp. IMCC35008 TaxID=2653858 RepID=UPI0013D5B111|nr:heterodisulfide reductase-related iron-sulfur binding cluster [Desulfopila sp. IMCC35008]
MKMAYYPGCSLSSSARDYNETIVEICTFLDIELIEIADWNCCGASSAHMTNQEVAMRLPMRNLELVGDREEDILVPCPACYQRLKAADKALKEDCYYWDVNHYEPKFELLHISSFLSRPEVLERIRSNVKKTVEDLNVACYYGCLSLRPPHITDAPDHEMPTTLEDIVTAVGASPVNWSHRTECCSGSLTMTRPDIAEKLVGDIVEAAKRGNATAMVTDCPMCQANVESRQLGVSDSYLPVYYATELIIAALRGEYPSKQQNLHLVPASILEQHLSEAKIIREDGS